MLAYAPWQGRKISHGEHTVLRAVPGLALVPFSRSSSARDQAVRLSAGDSADDTP